MEILQESRNAKGLKRSLKDHFEIGNTRSSLALPLFAN